MNPNEAKWVHLAREGDEDAFANIVELYQNPVYNLCYRMTGNVQEAEDASQETFWRAYQAIQRYDTNRSLITWLLSIAAHYCIDQHRRKKLPTFALDLLPEESVPSISLGTESLVVRKEEDSYLHGMLDLLKPEDRAAIILRYWYELSEEEISQMLNQSVSALKSRLHRARKYLAQQIINNQPQALVKEAI